MFQSEPNGSVWFGTTLAILNMIKMISAPHNECSVLKCTALNDTKGRMWFGRKLKTKMHTGGQVNKQGLGETHIRVITREKERKRRQRANTKNGSCRSECGITHKLRNTTLDTLNGWKQEDLVKDWVGFCVSGMKLDLGRTPQSPKSTKSKKKRMGAASGFH